MLKTKTLWNSCVKRFSNRDLLCMVGNWPFFFVCQMLQKVAIFFGFDVGSFGEACSTKLWFTSSVKDKAHFILKSLHLLNLATQCDSVEDDRWWQVAAVLTRKLLHMSTFRISFQKIRTAIFQLSKVMILSAAIPYFNTLHDMFYRIQLLLYHFHKKSSAKSNRRLYVIRWILLFLFFTSLDPPILNMKSSSPSYMSLQSHFPWTVFQ